MMKNIGWFIFGLMAISIGLYPSMYFIMGRDFGVFNSKTNEVLADLGWNSAFYLHITLGGIALFVGWPQFNKKLRTTRLNLHRILGKIYVFAALPSGLAGFFIAWFAIGGMISSIGFALLAIYWFSTTLSAYLAIRQRNLLLHEKMMIFSYSACFAAVTLRIWLPLLEMWFDDFVPAFRIVAWLSWVPNLLFAFFITRRMTKDQRMAEDQRPKPALDAQLNTLN